MPAHRKPRAAHLLTGTYKPGRHGRVRTADVGGIGEPPAHLTTGQKIIWRELGDVLPAGIGGASDRPSFELLVLLTERSRDGDLRAAAHQRALQTQFGFNPTGRALLTGSTVNDPDPDGRIEFGEWIDPKR